LADDTLTGQNPQNKTEIPRHEAPPREKSLYELKAGPRAAASGGRPRAGNDDGNRATDLTLHSR
jgi:hypothetical protein